MVVPVCERMAGQLGYPKDRINPPPAEKQPTALTLALTTGCSHAFCTFCDMYGKSDYEVKSTREFEEHVDQVVSYYRRNASTLGVPHKIFIGAGNALSVKTAQLVEATQYSLEKLMHLSGNIPNRLSMYGNVNDVLKQGMLGMNELRCGGTCLTGCSIGRLGERRGLEVLYLGVESGNDSVLRIAGKGYGKNDVARAAEILHDAKVRPSVMIMPGLGGAAYSDGHVKDTVEVINLLEPQWVTFIGLTIWDGTPYQKWIDAQEKLNKNRRLTPTEITEQTARMIEGISVQTTVGVHGNDVHTYGKNPVTLGAVQIHNRYEARDLARTLRNKT